jgi:tetratricopeptide (TPR) repeat protein
LALPRTRAERHFRIVLRWVEEDELGVIAELDGQPVASEQASRLDADFHFSYQDFLRSVLGVHRAPAEAAVAIRAAELARLGEAVGRAVFPVPVAQVLSGLLDEARSLEAAIALSFETAEPTLLPIPFEAARLPDNRVPALEPNVRVLRRHLGAAPCVAEPLPGPLRILVAVGAPDEGETRNAVLDIEAELQTILDAVDTARRYGNTEVRILEVGHPRQIHAALEEQSFHILHLSGHGAAGVMEMETEDGEAEIVTPKDLADAIHAAGRPLPLVFLASCLSGVAESETASFAQGLLEQDVPLVLAMQSTVSDRYATQLAGSFYGHLSEMELPLASHALALARQEVEQERRKALEQGRQDLDLIPEYATPSLFSVGEEKILLDRRLPQIELRSRTAPVAAGSVPLLRIGDLVGRRSELRTILRILRDDPRTIKAVGRKAGVAICGIGGIGKSAVAGRAISRLAEEGWRSVAVEGRWTFNELTSQIGTALFSDLDPEIATVAGVLVQTALPDEVRLPLLGQLLAAHPILLVLDNFEDNLTLGASAFKDASTQAILETLYRAANRGKLLLTSRYPLPSSEPWLERLDLGPLSSAQTRKLLYRLSELKNRPSEALAKVLRMIGGHPRMLEYLDAILRGGQGRLAIVEEKLRKNVHALGLRVEDLIGDLDQAVQNAIRVGAQDIFLEELLQLVDLQPGDREVLNQACVFPVPVDLPGVAFALAGAEPLPEHIIQVRNAAERLAKITLLTLVDEESVFVHRWTAEALTKTITPVSLRACYRKAGELILRRIEQAQFSNITDPIEAARFLLKAEDFDQAVEVASLTFGIMSNHGQTLAAEAFYEDLLSILPLEHRTYPGLLLEAGDALQLLGLTQRAGQKYMQALEICEDRVDVDPQELDHLEMFGVALSKFGELQLEVGEKEAARKFLKRALEVREQLVREDPNRVAYLKNLSVSYNSMGNLSRSMGQRDAARDFFAKDLEIVQKLLLRDPERVDYLKDLAISYGSIGTLYIDDGKAGPALASFKKGWKIARRLVRDEPRRTDLLQILSTFCEHMGSTYIALKKLEQARESLQESIALREELVGREPSRSDYLKNLSVSYERMSNLLLSLGNREGASRFLSMFLEIRETRTYSEPSSADDLKDLVIAYNRMGDLQRALGKGGGAEKVYEKGLVIAERLTAKDPSRADYQIHLVTSLSRAMSYDHERGASHLERIIGLLANLKKHKALPREYEDWLAQWEQLFGSAVEEEGP